MFRLKLTLLYLFTIVLVVAVMWVLIDARRDSYVQEQLYPSVKAAAASHRYLSQYRIGRLKEYVASFTASDMPGYIAFLSSHKDAIRAVNTRMRQEFPRRNSVPPDKLFELVEREAAGALEEYEKSLQNMEAPPDMQEGYPRLMRDVLASCMAEEESWAVCYFKLTYLPLTRIVFPEQRSDFGDAFPELFVIVDDSGTTRILFDNLDTSVDKLQKEDIYTAGVRYRNHIIENFDQTAEVLKQLKTSFEPVISSHLILGENRVFVVVASRILDKQKQYLGALIVGYELDKLHAWEDTAFTLGFRPVLEQCMASVRDPNAPAPVSEALCEYEASRQDRGTTYFARNRKGQLVRAGSSLNEQRANSVAKLVKNVGAHPSLCSSDLLAVAAPLPVDFLREDEAVFAAITIDLDSALAMFSTVKVVFIVLGAVVFLLGLVLIQVFVRSFTRPFEEIDRGIHEIIGGNFDYSFPFNFSEELPRSMGQSLSIMKAVLLGQPLPEDQERDDSWAANLKVEGEMPPLSAEISDGESELEEITSDKVGESATDYYRRLFKEYVSARESLGENVSNITYIKFVEKIAKTEKSLREKHNCKQILFRVETKDKQVVLVPIKVVDEAASK